MIQPPEEQMYIVPPDPVDARRWEETGLRHRMLDGDWKRDLVEYLCSVLNMQRAGNLGRMSRGISLFKSVVSQIACLYDSEPMVKVAGATPEQTADLKEMLTAAKTWQLAQRHSQYVVGLRESLYAIEWSDRLQTVTLRLVTPDRVVAEAPSSDPDDLRVIKEARLRQVRQGARVVTKVLWNRWSLDDGGTFGIVDANGEDMTDLVVGDVEALGGDAAEPYPYVWEDGEPYLPYVLYHAMPTSKVWDPYEWCEVVDGSFDTAVLWNLYHKIMRDASWSQKYTVDLELRGVSYRPDGQGGTGKITTSPDSVLQFQSRGDASGTAGTFQVAVDPDTFATAILQYQRTMVATIGIHPADIEQVTGSAQSGYAIQLKRSAQRREAQRFEPQFRDGDMELISKMARSANIFGDYSLPTEGYSITYMPPDDSIAERVERLDYSSRLVEQGLMSKVDQYKQEHPGASDEDAIEGLLNAAAIAAALADPLALIDRDVETTDDLVAVGATGIEDELPPTTDIEGDTNG